MKCINCKGEWTPPPGITVTECPFCKKSIEPTKTPKTYDDAKAALCFIAQTYGVEALLTKSLFSDIAPTLSDERELIKMFREKGALEVLKGALKSPASEQSVAIKRAIAKLPSYLQSSPEAISLLNDFTEALGWSLSPPAQPAPELGSIKPFGGYNWRVLDVQGGQALLLSEMVLEKRAYHKGQADITWESCTMRQYLNNDFYSNLLAADRNRVAQRTVYNHDNPWFGIKGGSNTSDKIFLLSIEEAVKYLGDGNLTRPKMSAEEKKLWDDADLGDFMKQYGYPNLSMFIDFHGNPKRIATDSDGKACWWWLRSPGFSSDYAAYVDDGGRVLVYGNNVSAASGGVRPALWLNL